MAKQPFITLVDQILAAKKQHTPLSPLDRGEFKDADTSLPVRLPVRNTQTGSTQTGALEREIDEMVYKLYGLTEDEIAIVEGKK